ncbi:MAG: hypothetical protein ACI4BD_04585 [Paludibacteraceae bacterium]
MGWISGDLEGHGDLEAPTGDAGVSPAGKAQALMAKALPTQIVCPKLTAESTPIPLLCERGTYWGRRRPACGQGASLADTKVRLPTSRGRDVNQPLQKHSPEGAI